MSGFDYEAMLRRYIGMVAEAEGIDFINTPPAFVRGHDGEGSGFSVEEWRELKRLAFESTGQTYH
jgi:hypothetical protein